METTGTIENLFLELGYNWYNMKINEFINVEERGYKILAFNNKTREKEYSLIKKIVRKKDSKAFVVKTINNKFECNKDHKVAIKFNILDNDFFYIEVGNIKKNEKFFLNENNNWVEGKIEKTNRNIPILDLELDNDHNYYSNNILSHNTIFGDPTRQPGGRALKFFSSIRLQVSRKEFIETGTNEDKTSIGIITKVKAVKNKVGTPMKFGNIKIIFGKGVQVEEEYIDYALSLDVLQRKGTWYFFDGISLGQGKEKAIEYFKTNEKLYDLLKKTVRDRLGKADLNVEKIENNEITEEQVLAEENEIDLKTESNKIEEELPNNPEPKKRGRKAKERNDLPPAIKVEDDLLDIPGFEEK